MVMIKQSFCDLLSVYLSLIKEKKLQKLYPLHYTLKTETVENVPIPQTINSKPRQQIQT